MSLRGVLDEAAGGLPDVAVSTGPESSREWSRGGQAFAGISADGSAVEFALDVAVAAAATRTPDVIASGRGAGWVRFAPSVLDDHGVDRVVAWFASAYRRAASG